MSARGGIVVLDFGGQYTQLIARRIREQEVFSAVLPCSAPIDEIRKLAPAGLVLSGGPRSVYDSNATVCDSAILQLGVPVLGICYGMQWIAHTLGGKVQRADRREYGPAVLDVENGSLLFRDLPRHLKIWNSHGDHVIVLPDGCLVTGRTENAVGAFEDPQRKFFAVEFHPEVQHTDHGKDILRNFIFGICGARPNWNRASFIAETVHAVRERVGDSQALCALSGGVDSTVAAVLVHRAIGERLSNVFVDTGLLRKNEFRDTLEMLRDRLKLNVTGVDASERFLGRLRGVTDPEEKRKRIGGEFIAVFDAEAKKLAVTRSSERGALRYLVQGTLYPDVIESVSVNGPSATIKTHHNVGGLPKDLPFELIEPLRDLFKDEVRQVGRELGLPEENLTQTSVSGAGFGGTPSRRDHSREDGHAAGRRCDCGRRNSPRRLV